MMEIDAWVSGYKVRSFPWIDGKTIYFNAQCYRPGQSLSQPHAWSKTVYITDDDAGGTEMIYECTESFELDKYDDNGFSIDGTIEIEKGSLWELNDDGGNIIGAEHHLDNCDGSSWIEIGGDSLEAFFKEADHAE